MLLLLIYKLLCNWVFNNPTHTDILCSLSHLAPDISRHRLQHPLRPAGRALGIVALQIQDGKTSAGHLCAAVGHQLLGLG